MQFRYINHVLNLSYLASCVPLHLDLSARPKEDRQQNQQIIAVYLDLMTETRLAAPLQMSESGQKRKSSVSLKMSLVGGRAEVDFGPLDVSL